MNPSTIVTRLVFGLLRCVFHAKPCGIRTESDVFYSKTADRRFSSEGFRPGRGLPVSRKTFYLAVGIPVVGMFVMLVANRLGEREIAAVAEQFIRALRDGDQRAAIALFEPERRKVAVVAAQESGAVEWEPHPEWDIRLHRVDRKLDRSHRKRIARALPPDWEWTGDEALAEIWVEHDDQVLKPTLILRPSEEAGWQIVEIVDVVGSIKAERAQQREGEARKASDEALADDLREKLEGIEGVQVERVPEDLSDAPLSVD